MWQVYGQDHLLRQLEGSLKAGRLAHAYLLVGPPHVGKMTLALNFAQGVNCAEVVLRGAGAPCGRCLQCTRIQGGHHTDVRILSPGGNAAASAQTVIGIGEVKEVLRQVNLNPFEGAYSVVIFDGADAMSEEAANALLKTLEEPPPQVLLLLLTSNEEAVLPTIRSRCRRLLLFPLPKDLMVERLILDHQVAREEAERLARLSRGCLGWAINAVKEESGLLEQRAEELDRLTLACRAGLDGRFGFANELATEFYRDREAAKQKLFLWLRWWRDLLLIKEGAEDYVQNTDWTNELLLQSSQLSTAQIVGFSKRILETLEALDRNASARLALEVLMLDLPLG